MWCNNKQELCAFKTFHISSCRNFFHGNLHSNYYSLQLRTQTLFCLSIWGNVVKDKWVGGCIQSTWRITNTKIKENVRMTTTNEKGMPSLLYMGMGSPSNPSKLTHFCMRSTVVMLVSYVHTIWATYVCSLGIINMG